MAQVTVWLDKFSYGWRGERDADGRAVARVKDKDTGEIRLLPCVAGQTADLRSILEAVYLSDAHFSPYHVQRGGKVLSKIPRLNLDCVQRLTSEGGEIRFSAIVLDVDDKEDGRHKLGLPARPEWRDQVLARIAALPPVLRVGLGWYETKGGFRLVWGLPEPLAIEPYIGTLGVLQETLEAKGIVADRLLDWVRLYRCPRVRRDGVDQTPRLEISKLGPMLWQPPHDRLQATIAEFRAKTDPKPRQAPDALGSASIGGTFDALAYLEARGHDVGLGRPLGKGGTLHTISPCVCSREETGTSCAVTIAENGALGLVCKKATCDYSETKMRPGQAWQAFRADVDPDYRRPGDTSGIEEWVASLATAAPAPPAPPAPPAQPAPHDHVVAPEDLSIGKSADPSAIRPKSEPAPSLPEPLAPSRATTATPALPDKPAEAADNIEPLRRYAQDLPGRAVADLTAAFSDQALEAARLLRKHDPGTFARLKKELKQSGVPVQDWTSAVKQHSDKKAAEADAAPTRFKRGDQAELAQVLCDTLKNEAGGQAVSYDLGKLHRYAPSLGTWEPIEDGALSRIVQKWAGEPLADGDVLRIADTTVRGTIKLACDLPEGDMGPGFFDAAPVGVAFQNGFVRLTESGLVVEALSPEHRARFQVPVPYDPQAKAPRWERFLQEVFAPDDDGPEKALLLSQFAAAALFGIATQYQRAMILVGPGANGKTVWLEAISALFPKHCMTAIPPQQFADANYGAKLAGSRFNVVGEVPDSEILHGEAFKGVVDGTAMTRREAYGRAFTFKPIAAQAFACNMLPGSADKTDGFWRRWLLVTWNRRFAPHERDHKLARYLIENELPGIARWVLQGAMSLIQAGDYTIPQSTTDQINSWRQESDNVAMFLAECTAKLAPADTWTKADEVYLAYVRWCEASGYKSASKVTFGKRLAIAGVESRKSSGAMYRCKMLTQSEWGGPSSNVGALSPSR